MSDNSVRRSVAGLATAAGVLVYIAGYVSGQYGWWWTVIAVGVIYQTLYRLIEV